MYICNRIHFVCTFLFLAVVGCRPSAKQIFRPRLVSTLFALLFIHSFSLSLFTLPLRSRRAIRAKGLIILMSFYYDYIWLLCPLSLSLLFPSLYNYCYKKNGTRTANERIKKATLFALVVLLYNQSELCTGNVLSPDIHGL
jgi:hypothetical protein